jgi:hypothetical protein
MKGITEILALVPWWAASLIANVCITRIEYLNRTLQLDRFSEVLPHTGLLILIAQWGLWNAWTGARERAVGCRRTARPADDGGLRADVPRRLAREGRERSFVMTPGEIDMLIAGLIIGFWVGAGVAMFCQRWVNQ